MMAAVPATPTGSPRTSSFFDTSSTSSPPPAPRWTPTLRSQCVNNNPPAPSPLSLSRASSVKRHLRPPPPPIRTPSVSAAELAPLHQSPSWSPSNGTSWRPPLPQSTDDIQLRFSPDPTYLLGQGRYAQVYLSSYKDKGGPWRLCAAKQLASDRESQTLGLREAFFLNRLSGSGKSSVYIVKLLAVKEDVERQAPYVLTSPTSPTSPHKLVRRRSSSIAVNRSDDPFLASSPSLPGKTQAAKAAATPAISRLVLLIEHAPLGTMDRLLRTNPTLVGRKLWERWAKQCTDAIAWVHSKSVLHADIKPGNLLLTSNLDIRLSDFGSSLLIHPEHPPMDGVGLGTLPFSPPELVNPNRSFSFPIDVFALGATLYQCMTGREPYRGCRGVEMMHHVRKGDLWVWEERVRIGKIGSSENGSPYPSAWREQADGSIKRGGSLRVPAKSTKPAARPSLGRMSSTESIRSEAKASCDSPAGDKLWANWAERDVKPAPIAALLGNDGELDEEMPAEWPEPVNAPLSPSSMTELYDDGSPVMVFLDGTEVLPEALRDMLKEMIDPDPEARPTAEEMREAWATSLGR